MLKVEGWGSAFSHRPDPRRQNRVVKALHTGTFENSTKPLSSDQGILPSSPYSAFPFRLQRMGCSDSAWGWAWNELLFELAGLVLRLADWAVTGCLPGLGGGRPQEGAPRKSLTLRVAAAAAAAESLGPALSHDSGPQRAHPKARSQRLEVRARGPSTWASLPSNYEVRGGGGVWEGVYEKCTSKFRAFHPSLLSSFPAATLTFAS